MALGPLRDAAVGDACRAAFARDELSEDDDAVARRLYAGEARETAMTLMKHKNSKSARRFRRLREELSSRTAGGATSDVRVHALLQLLSKFRVL